MFLGLKVRVVAGTRPGDAHLNGSVSRLSRCRSQIMASKRTRGCSIPWILNIAMLLLLKRIQAKDLVVGNQMGWTNYDLSNFEVPNYGAWAVSQRAVVGDSVVFKYAKGLHNVNLLPNRDAYLSCDFSRAMQLDNGASGMYIWRATSPGVYYFGCNKEVEAEGNHCGSGQKLALMVRASQASDEMGGVKAELAMLVATPGEAPVPGAAPPIASATPGAAPVPGAAAPPTATATPMASPVPGAAPPTAAVSPASSPATPPQALPAPATPPVSVAPATAPPVVAPVSPPAARVPSTPPPSILPASTPSVSAPAIPPPSTPPASSPSSPPSTILSPAPTIASPPPPPTSPTPTATPPSPSPSLPSPAPQTSPPSSAPGLSPVVSLASPPAPPLSAGATTGAPTPSTSGSSDSGRNLIAAILWGYLIATAAMALMLP